LAAIDVTPIPAAGLNDAAAELVAANAGGDTVSPGKTVILRVANGHATNPRTVTINDPNTPAPAGATAFNADLAVVVAALTEAFIPVPADRFADPADGLAHVSYSNSAADLTVAAYRL
jgi:hypothetical protein